VYQSDEVHCALVGWPSTPTFRKWSWYFVERIAMLKDDIIILANRFDRLDSETALSLLMVQIALLMSHGLGLI
jgi:hypothetical protein